MSDRLFKVQPSAFTDYVTEDGTEYQQLPKPYFVDQHGMIGRQDVWKGSPLVALGFMARLDVERIDLEWEDAIDDPSLAVGMYLVTMDSQGNLFSHQTAVDSLTELEAIKLEGSEQ